MMKLYSPVYGTHSGAFGVVGGIRSVLKIPGSVAAGGSER